MSEVRQVKIRNGVFLRLPERPTDQNIQAFARFCKNEWLVFTITEEVFLAAFPGVSKETREMVHRAWAPDEAAPIKISGATVFFEHPKPSLCGSLVSPTLSEKDLLRASSTLNDEGVRPPQGGFFDPFGIGFPKVSVHKKWVNGRWSQRNSDQITPLPQAGDTWLCDLIYHEDKNMLVAIPIEPIQISANIAEDLL